MEGWTWLMMPLAIFITIALLTYGVILYNRTRRAIKDRFKEEEKVVPAASIIRREEPEGRFKKRLVNWLSRSGKWAMKDEDEVSKVRASLIHAGIRQYNAPAVFYGLRAVLALLLPLPYLGAMLVQGKLTTLGLIISFALAGLGYFLPQYLLGVMVRRRQDRLDKGLPDVLDLFIVCMEAGLALQAAMNRVADEIKKAYPEFQKELQITVGELRTGIRREAALKNLTRRTGVQSIASLVTLMIQTERLGTSIAQALRTHSDFIRVQRAQKAEEMAAKTPIKILFPLIFFIFPAMFIVIVGPAAIQVVKNVFPALSGGG